MGFEGIFQSANQDEKLVKGLCEGKRHIFELVFRTYYSPLCRYAMHYLHDPSEAEEVVQDMFCKLWMKHAELEINTSLRSYLFKATKNHCINFIEHAKVQVKYRQYLGFQIKNPSVTPSGIEEKEMKRRISDILSMLPEKRREIFELSRFEGLRYQEIAERLNISTKTVEAQISKALDFLRKGLKDFLPVIVVWLICILFG